MFREKLVSVIMPVYNTEKYLREAIESILNQTYTNFEFIIINDGSTDGSLDIINEYMKKDDRIVLISRKNKGIVSSRNDGIRYAKGEYIAKMDSDDISEPTRFEKQVDYLNRNNHVYVLGTNYKMIYEEGVSSKNKSRYEGYCNRSRQTIDESNVFLSMSESPKLLQPTIMFRKEVFDIVGLYKECLYEDMDLFFRISSKGLGMAKLEEELVFYRGRETSESSTANGLVGKRQIITTKLNYLKSMLDDSFNNIGYLIWGADLSGNVAYSVLDEMLPNAKCLAYVDPMKDGELNGIPIVMPDDVKELDYDYVFICTYSGAKMAREFLYQLGKKEVEEFFKIS